MTRTLAEMTPDERAQCLGMWAEFRHDGTTELAIIREADPTGVSLFDPPSNWEYVRGDDSLWDVTPRPDLPRAWNPDGKPVRMEREVGGAIHTEYRVVGKVPGLISPASMPSMAAAVDYIRRAERHLVQPGDLKIQYCTITEWEDV